MDVCELLTYHIKNNLIRTILAGVLILCAEKKNCAPMAVPAVCEEIKGDYVGRRLTWQHS